MNRRDFHQHLAGTAALASGSLALLAGGTAHAQGAPVEGRDYVRLSTPAPVSLPADKKVEVLEFFWYGCPHCNAFEPTLEAWIKRLPPDVAFRRVHVGFGGVHQVHQKLFYALEETGQFEALHRKVFAAMHQQGRRLIDEKDIAAFVSANGGDGPKFIEAFKSFGVNTKATRAKQLTDAYKIDGVPAIGVHGRFYTSGSLAGPADRMLAVTNFLIDRARRG